MKNGWRKKTVGELAIVSRGASPRPIASPRWFDTQGDIGWVRIADVNRANGRELTHTTQKMSRDGVIRSRYIEPGSLILSIAASVGIPAITAIPTCIHDGFVSLTNLKIDKKLLFYLLKANRNRLLEGGQTGSQINVNSDIVRQLELWVPSSEDEQKRVASALWSADNFIDLLILKVEKKRAIKQGLMQELLTGKTRLPGFDSKWKKSSFGAELEFLRGSMATKELKHGRIPLIAAGIKPAGFVNKANRRGPIITISSSGANAGFVGWHVSDIWASDCTTVSRARGLDLKLAFYLLVYMQDSIYKSQTGGAQPHVHAKDVAPIEIRFPSDPLEQSAVVEVIDAADAEIQALEKQLESAKAIKQGMMQELLTGRTRLPKEGQ